MKHSKKVSIIQLFKYATKIEIFANIIGAIFAAGAGCAEPMMTLVFGKLVTDLNTFTTVSSQYKLNPDDPSLIEDFEHAQQQLRNEVNKEAIYMLIIGVCIFCCIYIATLTYNWTSERIAKRIRLIFLESILKQDVEYFDNVGTGEISSRIEDDTHLIQMAISEKSAMSFMFLSSFITGFIVAFVIQAKIAGVLLLIVPTLMIVGTVGSIYIIKYNENSQSTIASSSNIVEEVLSTIKTAKAFNSQSYFIKFYNTYLEKNLNNGYKLSLADALTNCGYFFVIYAPYALTFVWGTTLILKGQSDVGQVVTVFYAIITGALALSILPLQLHAVVKGQNAAATLYEVIERIPDIDSSSDSGLKPPSIEGNITFHDVNFSYPARPGVQVMKNFNATFPKGQLTALVGASGSGKSTSVSLIERFYDPLSGSVKVDGHDLRDLNVKWLRSKIGLVGQEPVLFHDSVRANVEHGLIGTKMENLPSEQKLELVIKACKIANADSFIQTLPEKYNNSVGDRGMLLSGGQKQRVAIARAIVSDPPILLLDEATAALDSSSESIVQKALDEAAKNRTTVSIAHRLSTIKHAQQIIVMSDGEIIEVGNHDVLTANEDSTYSKLVNAQKLSNDTNERPTENKIERFSIEEEEVDDDDDESFISFESLREKSEEVKGRSKSLKTKRISILNVIWKLFKINQTWLLYSIGILGSIMNGCATPFMGMILGKTLEDLSISPDTQNYHSILRSRADRDSLWFFIISIAATIGAFLQGYAMEVASEKLIYKLRNMSFRKLLYLDISFYDDKKNTSGKLTSSLSGHSMKVKALGGITLGTIIQSIATLICGLVIGISYNWKLGLVGTACIPLTLSSGIARLKLVEMKDEKNKNSYSESSQMACESANAIKTVASLTRENDCVKKYEAILNVPYRSSIRSSFFSSALLGLTNGINYLIIGLIFWYGSKLLIDLSISLQGFYVTLLSIVFASVLTGDMFTYVPDISSSKNAAIEIFKLITASSKIEGVENSHSKQLDNINGNLTFENVYFSYPNHNDTKVLSSFSLKIDNGSYVALVGPSGCGKSTIIQLLERFYDPIYGKITLDGYDIKDLDLNNLRSHIAYVQQEPSLYSGSIKSNILIGATKAHEEVTDEDLENVCRDANILDFIKALPDGFETEVGGKGAQLSGGQKQRIAIARALIRKPKILILDEATSALDQESEAVVQSALDKASSASGRTTITIAHRLTTIQKADKIVVLNQGQIIQQGKHEDLIKDKGSLYSDLVRLQMFK